MSESLAIPSKMQIGGQSLQALAKIGTPPPQYAIDADRWGALSEEDRIKTLVMFMEEDGFSMHGVEAEFPRVVMPSGKASWFTMPGEKPAQAFEAIVVFQQPGRAYWRSRDITGKPPECSSIDGIRPVSGKGPTGATVCAACPYDKFGSAEKREGKEQSGKACREFMTTYPWDLDSEIPWLFRIPATSLKPYRKYCQDLMMATPRTPLTSVVTEFALEKKDEYKILKLSKKPFPKNVDQFKVMERARELRNKFLQAMMARGAEEAKVSDELIDTPGTTTLLDQSGSPIDAPPRNDDEAPF